MARPSTTDKIKQILCKHGVGERQQIKTVASILDIAYVSSRQKFAGERNWTNEQLAKLARHFHEPIEDLAQTVRASVANGVLLVSGPPQRCICEIGAPLEHPESEAFIASQEGNALIVTSGDKAQPCIGYFQVLNLSPLPAPTIASLDDVPETSEYIAQSFAKKGIQVKDFVDPDVMLEAARQGNFEYYILDWRLSGGRTAAQTITGIRTEISTHVPIIILTGELRIDNSIESEIADLVDEFDDISILEKPVFNMVMANTVYKKLFFGTTQSRRSGSLPIPRR